MLANLYRTFQMKKIRKLRKSEALQIKSMELTKSYPLQGLHNLAYDNDNVNPAMLSGKDIMSSMFAKLQMLSERLNLRRSIDEFIDLLHSVVHLETAILVFNSFHYFTPICLFIGLVSVTLCVHFCNKNKYRKH